MQTSANLHQMDTRSKTKAKAMAMAMAKAKAEVEREFELVPTSSAAPFAYQTHEQYLEEREKFIAYHREF